MDPIRNSAKAIIIRDGMLLLEKIMKEDQTFYILPGGGQLAGETLLAALRRECREEMGAEVRPGELVLIREYIGKNHEFAVKDADVHQVEYMFLTELLSGPNENKATDTGMGQAAVVWVPLTELAELNVYPRLLKTAVGISGRIMPPIYRGDSN